MNRSTFSMFGLLFAVLLCVPANADTFTFTTLDDPSAAYSTNPCGISGNNIVGYYWGLQPKGSFTMGQPTRRLTTHWHWEDRELGHKEFQAAMSWGIMFSNQGPTQGFIT